MLKNPTRNAEFLATQLQSAGYFQLADDEALVLTIDPGDAGYFVVPVTNDWTITDDYWNEQTSLNNVQAKPIERDRLHDRHLPEGSRRGQLGVHRWPESGHDLDPIPGPSAESDEPADRHVAGRAAQSTRHRPARGHRSTSRPEQRDAQLAVRKAGFDKRFAPYPQ